VTSDVEVGKLMLDRDAGRIWISMIVNVNTSTVELKATELFGII
jgi:hypothetical protein